MKHTRQGLTGFTLIELLIVVAIIAILAAIAVPNFLEAQTRSKSSRVKNDMRTISVAMELYRVDNNSYPLSYRDSPNYSRRTEASVDPLMLTTPIAYTTSVFKDIFHDGARSGNPDYGRFIIYAVNQEMIAKFGNSAVAYMTYPKHLWITWSYGPDRITQTGGWHSLELIEESEELYYGTGAHDPTNQAVLRPLRYDPTNGTMSYGDIYAFQGGGFSF